MFRGGPVSRGASAFPPAVAKSHSRRLPGHPTSFEEDTIELKSEDLVHQFAVDWPEQYHLTRLTLLVAKLTEENEQLRAQVAQSAAGQPAAGYLSASRQYNLDETSVMTRD